MKFLYYQETFSLAMTFQYNSVVDLLKDEGELFNRIRSHDVDADATFLNK